jgi:hypothetical protein
MVQQGQFLQEYNILVIRYLHNNCSYLGNHYYNLFSYPKAASLSEASNSFRFLFTILLWIERFIDEN